jgi:hypothetical protein
MSKFLYTLMSLNILLTTLGTSTAGILQREGFDDPNSWSMTANSGQTPYIYELPPETSPLTWETSYNNQQNTIQSSGNILRLNGYGTATKTVNWGKY